MDHGLKLTHKANLRNGLGEDLIAVTGNKQYAIMKFFSGDSHGNTTNTDREHSDKAVYCICTHRLNFAGLNVVNLSHPNGSVIPAWASYPSMGQLSQHGPVIPAWDN